MSVYLSDHFSLAELTTTSHRALDNSPTREALHNLRTRLAPGMEQVREILGAAAGREVAVLVNSGFRSKAVNKAVGGSKTSAHMFGVACDFRAPRLGSPLAVCRALAASDLAFDQLIEEGTWVHISFDVRLRRQVLTKAAGGGYTPGLRAA